MFKNKDLYSNILNLSGSTVVGNGKTPTLSQQQDYILLLAEAMIKFGAPSHRIEDAIEKSARELEYDIYLLKPPAGIDMFRFTQIDQVMNMVKNTHMSIDEAIIKINIININKNLIPRWAIILAFATASFSTAPLLFGGSWVDALISFGIGGIVGLMSWLSEEVPSYSNIYEVSVTIFVAFVAEGLYMFKSLQVCPNAIKLASVVILLPGYSIVASVLDLSSRNVISGSIRLFYTIIYLLLLGYGLAIGSLIWQIFKVNIDSSALDNCTNSLDGAWNILFVPMFAISVNIWLKTPHWQWILSTTISIIGYLIYFFTSHFRIEASLAVSSFVVGLCGNIYQRVFRQSTFPSVVCAIFFLVPGGSSLKSTMNLFSGKTSNVDLALQTASSAIAISVGLFISSLVVYPMGKSSSGQMTF